MIIHISKKLLLIGIIKNYNRGSFILAVISVAPASKHIVWRGLPIRMEEVLQASGEDREALNKITAPDRGLVVTGSRFDRANEDYFDLVGGTHFREHPGQGTVVVVRHHPHLEPETLSL